MADVALQAQAAAGAIGVRPRLDRGVNPGTAIFFLLLLAAGVFFVAYSLYSTSRPVTQEPRLFYLICCFSWRY